MNKLSYTFLDIEHLHSILAKKQAANCQCGHKFDFNDITWSQEETDLGKPYCYVEILCQSCGTKFANFNAWWATVYDITDLLIILEIEDFKIAGIAHKSTPK